MHSPDTRDKVIGYYVSLFRRVPELSVQTNASPALIEERLQRHSTETLKTLKKRVDYFTDNSRSLLLHLIDEVSTEEDIAEVMGAQIAVGGLGYADIAVALEALRSYSDEHASFAAINFRSKPKQIAAIHHVTHAIRYITDPDVTPDASPLEYVCNVVGNRPVFKIKDKETLAFVLKHVDECKIIARVIRDYGEINLPALRGLIESGSTATHKLTRSEIVSHLTTLAMKPEVKKDMNAAFRYKKGHLLREDDFLNQIFPLVNQKTDDAKSLLLHLLQGSSNEDILRAIEMKPLLKGLTYKETAKVLKSVKNLPSSILLEEPEVVMSNPEKLIAIHLITEAVAATVETRDVIIGSPLIAATQVFIDKYPTYYLKDKGLLDLAMNHPEHAEAIAQVITSTGNVNHPSIDHIIEGGAKPLSQGAL